MFLEIVKCVVNKSTDITYIFEHRLMYKSKTYKKTLLSLTMLSRPKFLKWELEIFNYQIIL